ncbi:hypothetical protein ACXU4B_12800 [Dyella soli]|uniref:Autotransporter outer membrane beta-barrel domain-containing protein n=1 Tax=Dyella soli TaxID=522319 RepID=A0A4R0YN44_9GAMM|nr:hypothetical protein [Dyella soli]TCI06977.1 hypothetical protein EZM97_30640 [Dyella soli]
MKQALLLATLACLVVPLAASAQDRPILDVVQANLQRRANGMLALMGYSQTPDVTSGSLSIKNPGTDDPSFNNSSIGGGFTISKSVPIYLEGTLGYARYDPSFVATNGEQAQSLPTRWDSEIATAGIGWDFHLTDRLVLRPIINGSYGRVESEVKVSGQVVVNNTNVDVDFLAHGRLDAAGIGGSLMLDYQDYRPTHEVDVELRYTNIRLHSTNDSSPPVQGSSRNENVGLWARWRAPIGWHAFDRPVRYVLEFAHTTYLGQDADVLGFNHLTSLGAGLELDTSQYHPLWIYRARAVVRYVFGQNVKGVSLGLAVSFD